MAAMTRQVGTTARGYGQAHMRRRASVAPLVLAGRVKCARCGEPILPDQEWDLGHDDLDRSRYTGPEHARKADCRAGGNRSTSGRKPWLLPLEESTVEPDRPGLAADDPRFAVPWLEALLPVPADAVWPRYMTVPHPAAVGSLGDEFVAWAEARSGRPLRWWQVLVAVRLLEVDADGRLCWEGVVWSTARQVGKSWLLRELLLWRLHQGERFGEPQDLLHTGKDLSVCKEVQRPARIWAKGRPEQYKVREVNGQEEIEHLADGSRWMLRAKEAVYGYSAAVGAVDEAWKVKASSVDEGLTPTMVEREQPQLWLISTAHRLASALMLGRRQAALANLETGDGDLLVEWSAPQESGIADVAAWRLASPHWTEEPDPEAAFRAQWLNQWPKVLASPNGPVEALLPAGMWERLEAPGLVSDGPLFVAVEDDFGRGAAVAAACRLSDGRIEVDGWLCPDWDTALADVARLGLARRIRSLQVGASMLDRVPSATSPRPQPAGGLETRTGLPLIRDLAAGGVLVHDQSTHMLNDALAAAAVREAASGLLLVSRGPVHLLKALAWAVGAAHRPAPFPAVR